jgi:hypothetical protein
VIIKKRPQAPPQIVNDTPNPVDVIITKPTGGEVVVEVPPYNQTKPDADVEEVWLPGDPDQHPHHPPGAYPGFPSPKILISNPPEMKKEDWDKNVGTRDNSGGYTEPIPLPRRSHLGEFGAPGGI